MVTIEPLSAAWRLAGTPAGSSGGGWSDPVFVVSILCAVGGLILLMFDGFVRLRAASGAKELTLLVEKSLDVPLTPEFETMSADEKKKLEENAAKAQDTARDAIAAYKSMFLRFPQLIIGATLLVVPLLIAGGITFGG